MTEQAFNRSKSNMLEILKQQIKKQSMKVEILKSYQLQLENTHTEEELKQIHKEIFNLNILD